jgi:Icc-related predicted phosphoesterase
LKIQYCSDLHLEFEQNRKYLSDNPLRVCGDILILAGDIVPLHDEFLNNPFFRHISENYRQVFWVPGNHEYYYRNISDFSVSFNLKLLENINIVNNIELQYEGIQFIFSTLWSRISEKNEKIIEQSVSDFKCITKNDRKFKPSDFNKLHNESLSFVRQSVNPGNSKSVIVSHHVPSSFCNKQDHNDSYINEAFCVDLTDFIEKSNVSFWIYGHSHFNQKPIYTGKTILLTNQLGYIQLNEQNGFKLNAYFSI